LILFRLGENISCQKNLKIVEDIFNPARLIKKHVGIICPLWQICSHLNQSLRKRFRCTGACLNNSETIPRLNWS